MGLLTDRDRETGQRTIRRNDPCPCGSGRKFKHCHLTSVPSLNLFFTQAFDHGNPRLGNLALKRHFYHSISRQFPNMLDQLLDQAFPLVWERIPPAFWRVPSPGYSAFAVHPMPAERSTSGAGAAAAFRHPSNIGALQQLNAPPSQTHHRHRGWPLSCPEKVPNLAPSGYGTAGGWTVIASNSSSAK